MRRSIDRWRSLLSRLSREMTIWLATTREDNRPHLVPVWFVWLDDKIYVATGTETQKFANLRQNQAVALALPDTAQVIIIEGEAHVADYRTTDKIADYFYNKYEWDFRYDDSVTWRLLEITPRKILAWGDEYEYEGIRVL
ncbi:MAG: pyridoxamine 5'-phosphate oxidase family protein [Anaerolineales bacterium]|nr:pyridoxamine 5'-phosphate oxidase family protein [Anaerolineales bacterium]